MREINVDAAREYAESMLYFVISSTHINILYLVESMFRIDKMGTG
jgi:hypothetical protein